MGKPLTIGVTGLDKVLKKFGTLPKELIETVDENLAVAALDFESRAVSAAPHDEGGLRNQISARREGEMNWEVVSAAPYSAYMEWGTLSRVQVPADLQDYAAQFRGSNKKGDAKKAIYDWCKRVGIPEELWAIIFFKIMTRGVKPQPFFFIQRQPVQAALQKRLNVEIKKVLSK